MTNGAVKAGPGLGLDTNKQQNVVDDKIFQIFNHSNAFDVYKYDTVLIIDYYFVL